MSLGTLEQVAAAVKEFGREPDWHQHRDPKNLTPALIVEAAELLEPFQWLTPELPRPAPAQSLTVSVRRSEFRAGLEDGGKS